MKKIFNFPKTFRGVSLMMLLGFVIILLGLTPNPHIGFDGITLVWWSHGDPINWQFVIFGFAALLSILVLIALDILRDMRKILSKICRDTDESSGDSTSRIPAIHKSVDLDRLNWPDPLKPG